ncbi:Disheveled-associated activator of morphogenesis 2 [Penicillium digitatum]|uniref:Disheveled-associated activator of morphogenesis 2 n=1 Tax=Penicillium digitatum TaxID=36651 RepID=A0A7T6XQS5_PENDI|nr:Disheveled-associated activator of morphogenesis 2 [Penicillium digitatum]
MDSTPELPVHTSEDLDKEQPVTQKISNPYPSHPIPQLQGPFEESIVETTDGSATNWVVDIDAQTRRRDLLKNEEYERLCGRKWRQRASEKYHPFWKLVSQMIFGVHLLAKSLAKSETSVMKILQKHVNELDGFLERTTEDFLIVRLDVHTRIQYLSLPLGNLDVFDEMLEDRNFRLSVVSYNDQIEHSIARFTLAITDSLKDLQKAKEALGALWFYFRKLTDDGCFKSESLRAFHQAMVDNVEGWIVALSKLRRRGTALQKALIQLGLATTEMQRRVGIASRKDVQSFIKHTSKAPDRNKSVKQRIFDRGQPISEKPLPLDPLSKSKRTPTASKQFESPPSTAKTQTSIPADQPIPSDGIRRRIMSRAKSCNVLPAEAGTGASNEPPPVPSTPGRLKRQLSKHFLPKRSVSEKLQARPKTAPSQPSRLSRNISIEQLRAFCATPRPRTGQSTVKSPTHARQEAHNQLASGQETMKNQISQFLKTDRVVEAWDNVSKTACCTPPITKTRDWPSSIFRTKSSTTLENKGNTSLPRPDLQRQMSWVQETFDVLPTYSFKTKPDMSPRIHVLSVQMTHEDTNWVAERETSLDQKSEHGLSITALPAVPPSIPSVS